MGAINWIDSNPTTAAIRTNEARDLQQAQAAESLLAAREARQRQSDMDAAYGAAADELATKTKPTPSALSAVAPAQMYNEMGSPVPATDLAKATPGATIPQVAQQQSVLSTVTADSGSGNVSALKGMRNSGKIRYEMAQAQQKRNVQAEDEAIKAIGKNNWQLAEALDKKYGLNLNLSAQNPTSLQVMGMFANSLEHLKHLEPAQTVAYMDASTKKFKEVYTQTQDRNKALEAGSEAGMTAARGVRPKGTGNLVETPDGYFNRDTGDYEKGKDGKVLRVPDRRLNFNPSGGGGAGGSPKAVATMEWKSKSYQALGISPELSNAIAANPGFATTPQAVQKQAQFIQKASADVMGRPTKTADQAMQEARQLMQGAQSMALETMGGTSPVKPSAPAAPQGRVRRYVPGQGFVDQ